MKWFFSINDKYSIHAGSVYQVYLLNTQRMLGKAQLSITYVTWTKHNHTQNKQINKENTKTRHAKQQWHMLKNQISFFQIPCPALPASSKNKGTSRLIRQTVVEDEIEEMT